MTRVELWLKFKTYRRALSIPFDDTTRFTSRPLAWLNYVAYTIYGGSGGRLSLSADGQEVDCHAENIQQGTKYYYVSGDSRLLDPNLMEDRTSFATAYTTRRADFRTRVVARDQACILTGGNAEDVQACHIVPHSKGTEYMINVLNIRSEDALDFDGIDDPRNGILLNPTFYRGLGESRFAFLHTPNKFMTVYDVDRVLQSNANLAHVSSANPDDERLTFQHFNTGNVAVATLAPHNCDARLSGGDDWPPDVIFDAAYGIAALKQWGTPAFREFLKNLTKYMYDDEGAGGDENGGGDIHEGNRGQKPAKEGPDERTQRAMNRAKKKNTQQATNAKQSPDFPDLLLGIWKFNALEGQRKAHALKAERTKKKVQTWLDSAV